MQSFLILSKDKKAVNSFLDTFLKQRKIHPLDKILISYQETKDAGHKTSIGIEDVRTLEKNVFLKPIKGDKKAAIVYDAHRLTVEAQNALLKVLEEPPESTYIFLIGTKVEDFLSTILSRTYIIKIPESLPKSTLEKSILENLFASGVGTRLKLAQDISKNKEDAIVWLENAIISLRELVLLYYHEQKPQLLNLSTLSDGQVSQLLLWLSSFQKTYTVLKISNVNTRLALENLLLNI